MPSDVVTLGIAIVVACLAVMVRVVWGDRCDRCGEECTPMEADLLFGSPCWACVEEEELLREIRRGRQNER
jgi:hypothetical protein